MSVAKIKNLYIARLTTQERPCFVCSKFTSVVLTSADNSNDDWFYTCRSHLGDFHFCSRITDSSSPKPTKQKITSSEKLKDKQPESDSVVDLVSSIGSAFKSWRNNNKTEEEKGDNKKEDKEDKEEEKKDEEKDDKDEKEGKGSDKVNEQKSSPSSPSLPSSSAPPRFILQRDYFYLRQREYIKKLQKKQADETLKTLDFPSVPKGIPGSSSPTPK
ncbi:VPS4-associated protein 1 [Cunninghamella echinulata]|nr:VPS4-associated protein 1 [Cunninghamella echinulata]